MRPNQIITLLIILVAIMVLGIISIPRALSLNNQTKAGRLLNEILPFQEEGDFASVPCVYDPISSEDKIKAEQAVVHLNKATDYDENMSHAYLLLGRAYCLLGKYEDAVTAYEQYTDLRTDNPIGHLELGFAYEKVCKKENPLQNGVCEARELVETVNDEWGRAKVVVSNFIEAGDNSLAKKQYKAAEEWYQRAVNFSKNPSPSLFFQWNVASVLAGKPLPGLNSMVRIYPIEANTQIEAENLYWYFDKSISGPQSGELLSKYPVGDGSMGVLWWKGTALAFVNIPEETAYKLTVRVQDNSSDPIGFQVERDFFPIEQFVLNQGDFSWKELEAATVFSPGIHLIGIRFLEDTGDLSLDWIQFQKLD